MYGGGRILSIVKTTPLAPCRPLRAEPGGPIAVAAFVSAVQERGIVNSAEDFGMPGVTDMDATTVLVHGEGAPARWGSRLLRVVHKGLTVEQQRARATLRQVIDAACNLAAVGTRAPYTPGPDRGCVMGTESSSQSASTPWRAACGQARPAGPGAGLQLPHRRAKRPRCTRRRGQPRRAVAGGRGGRVLAVNPMPVDVSCP